MTVPAGTVQGGGMINITQGAPMKRENAKLRRGWGQFRNRLVFNRYVRAGQIGAKVILCSYFVVLRPECCICADIHGVEGEFIKLMVIYRPECGRLSPHFMHICVKHPAFLPCINFYSALMVISPIIYTYAVPKAIRLFNLTHADHLCARDAMILYQIGLAGPSVTVKSLGRGLYYRYPVSSILVSLALLERLGYISKVRDRFRYYSITGAGKAQIMAINRLIERTVSQHIKQYPCDIS